MKRSKISAEEIVRLYTIEKLSLRQIAKIAGISYQAVHGVLDRAYVEFRPRGPHLNREPFDKKVLKKLYLRNKLSVVKIAALFNVSSDTIRKELERHKIQMLDPSTRNVKYPQLRELKIGESIELPRPPGSNPWMPFHRMAAKTNIRVSTKTIDRHTIRVTRIADYTCQ